MSFAPIVYLSDLASNNAAQITQSYHSAKWVVTDVGGPGACSLYIKGSRELISLPRFSKVDIRLDSISDPAYIGVVIDEEPAGEGLREVMLQDWGRYWLGGIRPIEQYTDTTVGTIVLDLLNTYVRSSGAETYHATGKVLAGQFFDGRVEDSDIPISDFLLDGSVTLFAALSDLAYLAGYKFGIYPIDPASTAPARVWFKPQTTSEHASFRVGDAGVSNPECRSGRYYNAVNIVGRPTTRWTHFEYPYVDVDEVNAIGRLFRHSGLRVPWVGNVNDARRIAKEFLKRYNRQSEIWSFSDNQHDETDSFRPDEGHIVIRSSSGAIKRDAPVVSYGVDISDHYRITYDYGNGENDFFGSGASKGSSAITELMTRETVAQVADSALSSEFDGRIDIDYNPETDDDGRDTNGDGVLDTAYANTSAKAVDDFKTVVRQIADELILSAYGTAEDTITRDRWLDALTQIFQDNSTDNSKVENVLNAIEGAIFRDSTTTTHEGDQVNNWVTLSDADVNETITSNYLEKIFERIQELMESATLPDAKQTLLGEQILATITSAFDSSEVSTAVKEALAAAILAYSDFDDIIASINNADTPVTNVALVVAGDATSTPVWNLLVSPTKERTVDDVHAFRTTTLGNKVT